MKKPKFEETIEIDNIRCPWCGELFDGRDATNNNQDLNMVDCPHCENRIEIFQSVEYLAQPYME